MDKGLLEEIINSGNPFKIETASGKIFEVPHRDFVAFSLKKTTLLIFYEEDGEEHFAMVPLLTITSAMSKKMEPSSS